MIKLDEYEADILQSVENGEWQTRGDVNKRVKELHSYIKNQKKKALESGVPYQNIIQMLIDQFASNKIKLII